MEESLKSTNIINAICGLATASALALALGCGGSSDDGGGEPAKLTLSETTLTMPEGSVGEVVSIIEPINAETLEATWTSSDASKVAFMNLSGQIVETAKGSSIIVSPVAPGDATVTAKVASGATGTCDVTVTPAPSVYLDGAPLAMAAGGYVRLAGPSAVMADALASSNAGVIDFAVAPDGRVFGIRAIAPGTAEITFTDANGEKLTCTVTVGQPGCCGHGNE
jgi:hypothetical protein